MRKRYIDAEKLVAALEKRLDENCSLGEKAECFNHRAVEDNDILALIEALREETPETPEGKFVFPEILYVRTVDNKTLDVSYIPQDMSAIEYIRNE